MDQYYSKRLGNKQDGLSLVGLILTLAVLGALVVLALKIVPTFVEYRAVLNAIKVAKTEGTSPSEVKKAFDRAATATYIDSISGKDLVVVKVENEFEISFSYEKKIPLFGPASLVMDYEGTTAKNGVVMQAAPAE